jgi:hypothetical protein
MFGEGSDAISRSWPDLISSSRFAIALDRQGYSDVITHQARSRCCSDAFAESLAGQLNDSIKTSPGGLGYQPSSHGVFTDTANYTGIIGECTNLSVGYFDQHSSHESLDVFFLSRLFVALCSIDPTALVDEHKPGIDEPADWPVWFRQSTFWETCEYCGIGYDPATSYAKDFGSYCSAECETEDISHYLDPAFGEVQRALRKVQ